MGKKGGGGGEAAQARADEQERQNRIREGTAKIGDIFSQNFTDDYFKKQQDNYVNYATPQLEQQKKDAQKELTFSLARSGNLDSSARGDLASRLQQKYDLNRQDILDKGLSYSTQARNNVEDARTGLVNTLNATGDAEGAASSALTRASALSQPAAYSPLTQLFTDFTGTLGTQAAAERAFALGGAQRPTYVTGLFGQPKNSVSVSS